MDYAVIVRQEFSVRVKVVHSPVTAFRCARLEFDSEKSSGGSDADFDRSGTEFSPLVRIIPLEFIIDKTIPGFGRLESPSRQFVRKRTSEFHSHRNLPGTKRRSKQHCFYHHSEPDPEIVCNQTASSRAKEESSAMQTTSVMRGNKCRPNFRNNEFPTPASLEIYRKIRKKQAERPKKCRSARGGFPFRNSRLETGRQRNCSFIHCLRYPSPAKEISCRAACPHRVPE